MSTNKLLILAAIGAASIGVSSGVLAGEIEYTPSYAGIYFEGNLGYAARNWINDTSTPYGTTNLTPGALTSVSNGRGGFAGGGDVGYQFNQYFSVEGGWYYLPSVSGTFAVAGTPVFTARVDSGLAYGAFKMATPVYENMSIFGKLGAGYGYNSVSGAIPAAVFLNTNNTGVVTQSNYWKPLWAVGIQYYFNTNLSINFQYMNTAGYHSSSGNNFAAPDTNLFTAGVGYKFLM